MSKSKKNFCLKGIYGMAKRCVECLDASIEQVRTGQVGSGRVKSGQVKLGQVKSRQFKSSHVKSKQGN